MTTAARQRMAGSAISPEQAGPLALWFKADALGLADGNAVSSWTDSSGNARHAVQATGSKQPLFKTNIIGGMPVVRFDTTDNLLTGTFTALAQPNTVIAVVRPIGAAGSGNIVDSPNGNRNQFGERGPYEIYAGGLTINGPTNAATGVAVVATAIFNGGASVVRVNGLPGSSNNAGSEAPTRYALASNAAENGEFWNGDIAEVCIYNFRVGGGLLQRVERFLGVKYGISVA